MADIQHIFVGTSDPATAPTGIAHHYVNTTTGVIWESIGTTLVSDWSRNSKITSGTGAPVTTPLAIGDVYIDITPAAEVPYTAVHTTDATGWSLGGGGGGGSSGPISTDFADYLFIADNTAQTITLDITKRHHRITLDRDALLNFGGALEIVLPNATDLAEVDYSADVFFSIIIHSTVVDDFDGRFNRLSSIGLKVNGGTLMNSITSQPISTSTYLITSCAPGGGFDLNDVRSVLWIEARLIANGMYAATFIRDSASIA